MSELQRIIKEEIEYALLEENVELEEGIGRKIAGALAGLAMMGGVAKAAPVPVKIVDMRGETVAAHVINAKDKNDALQKAQEIASEMGQFFAEPSTEEEVRTFKAGAEKPAAKASSAVKSSQENPVKKVVRSSDGKGYVVTVTVPQGKESLSQAIDLAVRSVKSKTSGTETRFGGGASQKSVNYDDAAKTATYEILVK